MFVGDVVDLGRGLIGKGGGLGMKARGMWRGRRGILGVLG